MEIGRQDGWTSVNKQMPPVDEIVLVWVNSYCQNKGAHDLAMWHNNKWLTFKGWELERDNIDFWMDLPDGPDLTL